MVLSCYPDQRVAATICHDIGNLFTLRVGALFNKQSLWYCKTGN